MSFESSKRIETNKHELVVKVLKEEFQAEVTKVFRKESKNMQVPGFRKGKAPRPMVENIYGKEVFWEDAVNNLYPVKYREAVKAAEIEPVDSADVEVTDLSEDGFTFTASVIVKPEVTLGDYKGLKAEKVIATVVKEDIDKELNQYREKNARKVPVEDRAAKEGDVANIDFEGLKDDVAFEGGKGENFDLELGAGQFIPGFEEKIIGHNVGEEFDIDLTFPEEYHSEDLKGADVVFKIKINSLTEKQLPDLDDELAKDVSEFDTLEELTKDITSHLQGHLDEDSDRKVEDALVDQVADSMKAEIPEVMFEHRVEDMVKEFEQSISQQGMNIELYLQYSNLSMEEFKKDFSEQAERQVKVQLALEEVAKLEKIEITDEDFEKQYEKMGKMYNMEAEMIKNFFPKENLENEIKLSKAIDIIKDSANIKEVAKKEIDEKEAKKPSEKSMDAKKNQSDEKKSNDNKSDK